MKYFWEVNTKNKEYVKILKNFSFKEVPFDAELYHYLTTMICDVVEERKHIFIEFDTEKNNTWKTNWLWSTPENRPDSSFQGVLNIKLMRKYKLKKLNEI